MPYKNIQKKRKFHREYMREYNKSHALTEEQKKAKSQKNKIWRELNKEKLAEYQRQRWKRDKEKIVLRKKAYNEANAEKQKERRKKYYLENKEKFSEKSKKYYAENKEKTREYKKVYSRSPRGRFKSYQFSAKKRGHTFELTEDLFYAIIAESCHYCGLETSYGVDRKDSKLGYTIENTLPCCKHCNFMKRDTNYEEFIEQINKICKHLSK